MFWDKVFDSVNGFQKKPKNGKLLRCAVSDTSPHLKFWREAKSAIKNMHFEKEGTEIKGVPTLKNWLVSLGGFEEILKMLKKKNINFFSPRVFNQDPLENFFGQIRQHGFRNVNPTSSNFKHNFKTLLVTNFISSHSVSANCENENSTNIISSVRHFVTQGLVEDETIYEHFEYPSLKIEGMAFRTFVDQISIGYISGFIAKNLKKFNACLICRNNLFCNATDSIEHALIREKEFDKNVPKKLKYCSPQVIEGIMLVYEIILKLWPQICHEQNTFHKLSAYIFQNVKFNFVHLCEHTSDMTRDIILQFSVMTVYNWCNGINKKLTGKDERKGKMYDDIFKQAFLKNKKRLM